MSAQDTNVSSTDGAHLTARGVAIQTGAMLLDAYRELNAKKLFWITMGLSSLVVASFAAVGFNASGFSIFGKQFDHPILNATVIPKAQLYEGLFTNFGVAWWLGFLAIILALVSTASMFPDFLGSGAVDLYLARPLGRLRLFVTKYVVGLLFVTLQVTVFCVASLLVIGIRGGVWVPGILLAVPVVVLLFSYLWSICALVGTLTRSTIASLLLTMLAWFGIFGIHSAETLLLWLSTSKHVELRQVDQDIADSEARIARLQANPASTQPHTAAASQLDVAQRSLEATRGQREQWKDDYAVWHTGLYAAKWPLPKTSETTALLNRWLDVQIRRSRGGPPPPTTSNDERPEGEDQASAFLDRREVRRQTAMEVDQIFRSRSAVWVIGTSLLFEAAMIGLAGWVFARRDY